MSLSTYRVTVQNEITDEMIVIECESDCQGSAQVAVLQLLFHRNGWRKAVALVPEVVEAEAEAA